MADVPPVNPETDNPEIALIFPPLVETNFGSYYPSTAVLAGYLSSVGISSIQADLNEDFAVYMLEPANLNLMGKGEFGGGVALPPESIPAVSARLLERNRHLLFDEQGKHRFREDSSEAAYLLNMLVKPFRIDPAIDDMACRKLLLSPVAKVFEEFFSQNAFIHSLPPDISAIGIAVPLGPQLGPALILANHLKALFPQVSIILGGPTISLMTEANLKTIIMSNPAIYAAISSDGEYPLKILVEQIKTGLRKPELIPGVSCRVGETFVHHPPAMGIDLNSIPFAKYDSALLSRLSKPEIGIVQARGCYWGKCAYCDYIEIYRGNPAFRTRIAEKFVDEIVYQQKTHGVNRFSVITEAIPPAFAEKMSRIILNRKLNIVWQSFAIADNHFTTEIFKLMAQSGCEFLAVGIETMSDRVLSLMRKASTFEGNIHVLQAAKKAGLSVKINLIPDLPTTTFEEARETLSIIEELECYVSYVSCFPFEATLSSQVGREPGRFRLRVAPHSAESGQAQFRGNHLEIVDPAMTAAEKAEVLAAYQDFAAWFNNRPMLTEAENTNGGDVSLDEALFVLADESLDFIRTEQGIQCYNWATRTRFRIPEEWVNVIERMRGSRPFSRDDFSQWVPDYSSAEFYFEKLLEKGILTVFIPRSHP